MKKYSLLFIIYSIYCAPILALSESIGIDARIITTLLIAFNAILFAYIIINEKQHRGVYTIVFISYLLKIALLYFDIYGRGIFVLPNSGADSEVFYRAATDGRDILKLNGYTLILRMFNDIFGNNRILFQYINVVVSTLAQITIIKTLTHLKIKEKTIYKTCCLAFLLPNHLIISSILLRESIIIYLVSLSIYYLVKWYNNRNRTRLYLISIIPVLISSYLHSSMIFLLIPGIFLYIFSDKENHSNKLKFNRTTIGKFIALSIILSALFVVLQNFIFKYFADLTSIESISEKMINYSTGSAAYLQNLANVKNPIIIFITSPIKLFYFYLSPMPWDWRGINDIIAFILSSAFYGIVIYKLIKVKNKKPIETVLAFSLLFMGLIYGLSCFNSGTAIRHREKMYPMACISTAIIIENKREKNAKK